MSTCCNYACRVEKAEVEQVRIDFSFAQYVQPGQNLDTVIWRYSDGIEIVKAHSISGDVASVIVGGGTAGNGYTVCAHGEMSDGTVKQLCARIQVYECPTAVL